MAVWSMISRCTVTKCKQLAKVRTPALFIRSLDMSLGRVVPGEVLAGTEISVGGGGRGRLKLHCHQQNDVTMSPAEWRYTVTSRMTLHCHQQKDFCIIDDSHFNVLLTVWGTVHESLFFFFLFKTKVRRSGESNRRLDEISQSKPLKGGKGSGGGQVCKYKGWTKLYALAFRHLSSFSLEEWHRNARLALIDALSWFFACW